MSALDKAKAKAEELAGAAEEKVGELTGNEQLQAEGAAQEAKGSVKGTAQDVVDGVKDAFKR